MVLVLTAAQRPTALAEVNAGLWEVSGVPGARTPTRECIADVAALAQFEHRGRSCASNLIRSGDASALIEYRCGGVGFGRSKIDVITPRNLRIDTQGISDNLPFAYVLQARRLGECPAKASAASAH